MAFPTPEERARIKVGGTIPVRYDSNDHRRVVVTDQTDKEAGELREPLFEGLFADRADAGRVLGEQVARGEHWCVRW